LPHIVSFCYNFESAGIAERLSETLSMYKQMGKKKGKRQKGWGV
jgi:hypothetical protein